MTILVGVIGAVGLITGGILIGYGTSTLLTSGKIADLEQDLRTACEKLHSVEGEAATLRSSLVKLQNRLQAAADVLNR